MGRGVLRQVRVAHPPGCVTIYAICEEFRAAATPDYQLDDRGGPIRAGHFMPEEAPEETSRRLAEFLAEITDSGDRRG